MRRSRFRTDSLIQYGLFTLLVIALALNWLLRKPDVVQPDFDAAQPVPTSEGALVRSSFLYLWRRLDWGAVLNWVLWPYCGPRIGWYRPFVRLRLKSGGVDRLKA